MGSFIQAVATIYVELDETIDDMRDLTLERFALKLEQRGFRGWRGDVREMRKAIMNQRKQGRLPRIRDGHGPEVGSGGGHTRTGPANISEAASGKRGLFDDQRQ
jgi:hypothetical protein